jgi:hypothetical protein
MKSTFSFFQKGFDSFFMTKLSTESLCLFLLLLLLFLIVIDCIVYALNLQNFNIRKSFFKKYGLQNFFYAVGSTDDSFAFFRLVMRMSSIAIGLLIGVLKSINGNDSETDAAEDRDSTGWYSSFGGSSDDPEEGNDTEEENTSDENPRVERPNPMLAPVAPGEIREDRNPRGESPNPMLAPVAPGEIEKNSNPEGKTLDPMAPGKVKSARWNAIETRRNLIEGYMRETFTEVPFELPRDIHGELEQYTRPLPKPKVPKEVILGPPNLIRTLQESTTSEIETVVETEVVSEEESITSEIEIVVETEVVSEEESTTSEIGVVLETELSTEQELARRAERERLVDMDRRAAEAEQRAEIERYQEMVRREELDRRAAEAAQNAELERVEELDPRAELELRLDNELIAQSEVMLEFERLQETADTVGWDRVRQSESTTGLELTSLSRGHDIRELQTGYGALSGVDYGALVKGNQDKAGLQTILAEMTQEQREELARFKREHIHYKCTEYTRVEKEEELPSQAQDLPSQVQDLSHEELAGSSSNKKTIWQKLCCFYNSVSDDE